MYQQKQDFEHGYASREHETQHQKYEERATRYDDGVSNRHTSYGSQGFTFNTNPTSLGSSLLAICSYLFLWPGALMLLLFVRENRFVRFHALQSLFFFGVINVIYVIFFGSIKYWPLPLPHLFWVIPLLVFLGVNIIAFIAWIVGIVGALRGDYVHLPFAGEFAAQHTIE